MTKKNDAPIKVVGVPRERPDLQRLAKAIVALALAELAQQPKPVQRSSALTSPPDGAAA
jgi:hypothetical protein